MVSTHISSIGVHRSFYEPSQQLQNKVRFQLINRLGIDRFLKCQRQLINELTTVFEPPDPVLYYSMLKLPPKDRWLCWTKNSLLDDSQSYKLRPINQGISLFDIYPQPPNSIRKEKLKS